MTEVLEGGGGRGQDLNTSVEGLRQRDFFVVLEIVTGLLIRRSQYNLAILVPSTIEDLAMGGGGASTGGGSSTGALCTGFTLVYH